MTARYDSVKASAEIQSLSKCYIVSGTCLPDVTGHTLSSIDE